MGKVMYVRGKPVKPKGLPAVVETVATREPEEVSEIIQHDEPPRQRPTRQLKGGSLTNLSKALNAIKPPRKKSNLIRQFNMFYRNIFYPPMLLYRNVN
jgi:hypothetical protein